MAKLYISPVYYHPSLLLYYNGIIFLIFLSVDVDYKQFINVCRNTALVTNDTDTKILFAKGICHVSSIVYQCLYIYIYKCVGVSFTFDKKC